MRNTRYSREEEVGKDGHIHIEEEEREAHLFLKQVAYQHDEQQDHPTRQQDLLLIRERFA